MILIQAFIVQDPIVDISLCVNQVTLHEETASVLHGCLVAKTPDDSVIVVSMRKVSKRNIEFVDGCESCEPEQLPLECSNESFDTAVSFWTPDE